MSSMGQNGPLRRRRLLLLLWIGLACLSAGAYAQGRGPGGGPGGGGMPRGGSFGGGGRMEMGDRTSPPPGPRPGGNNPTESTMSGGMQLGPPGRWWDNKSFAQSIGLDSGQQHRMDGVLNENKGVLLKLYKNLQHEQSELSKATRAKELNENQIFQQIDRVSQARAELEKANAHMLLQIRKEMSPDQASRLDDHRPAQ